MSNNIVTSRKDVLLEQLVLVDGQPACGKAALDPAIASMERVELLKLSPVIENICGLRYLDKLDDDSAETLIKIEMDLVLYETMMGRNINFRITDQSSAFKDTNFIVYLKRLFQSGDKIIPTKIKEEKPILHFMTHAMLGVSQPLFRILGDKLSIIELVRHPKSMLYQQTAYNEWWLTNEGKKRQFQLFIKYNDEEIPFWANGWEELYIKSNPVDRAIYEMSHHFKITDKFKNEFKNVYESQCITVPFEKYVVNPWPYLTKIEALLKTKVITKTRKVLKKEGVPRKKTTINDMEINKLLKSKESSKNALKELERISSEYEKKYL